MLCEVQAWDEGVWVVAVWGGVGVQVSSEGGGMTDYKALVEQIRSTPTYGTETRAELMGFALEAADAVEALLAERDAARHIIESHTCGANVELAYRRTLEAQAERDEALKALGEARARFGDVEQRLVEAEAVINQLRDEANAIVDTTRVNGTDFERGQENVAERVFDVLALQPSVVLADNNAAVWDEAVQTVLTVPPGLDGWTNPYRGEN